MSSPAAPVENTPPPSGPPNVPTLSEVAVVSGSVSGTLVSWLGMLGVCLGITRHLLGYGPEWGIYGHRFW